MDKAFTLYSDKAEDVATSSSFRQFKIDHFHLDLKVDFEQKTISGTETIQLQCIQDGQSELQLDIHPTLSVHEITFSRNARDWTTTQFLIRDFTNYGTTLVVKFPKPFNSDDKLQLAIKYTATDGPGVGMQTAFNMFCLIISILTAHDSMGISLWSKVKPVHMSRDLLGRIFGFSFWTSLYLLLIFKCALIMLDLLYKQACITSL